MKEPEWIKIRNRVYIEIAINALSELTEDDVVTQKLVEDMKDMLYVWKSFEGVKIEQ